MESSEKQSDTNATVASPSPSYKLHVTRCVNNPAYVPPARYRHYNDEPPEQPTIETTVLDVYLTQEEFFAIKRAVLECVR